MPARERIAIRVKRALRHMKPSHVIASRVTRKIVEEFADQVGMVYFGHVDANEEGHRQVRGHTVSATNLDTNYSVGTIQGYDVLLVCRNDVVKTYEGQGSNRRYHWLIITADLHTTADVPHVYVGHRSRDEAYKASHTPLFPVALGTQWTYPSHFMKEYSVYGLASQTINIERIITPQVTDVIMSHFQGASFEIDSKTLYVYIESEHPTRVLLERMLSNCLWLAQTIDINAEWLRQPDNI